MRKLTLNFKKYSVRRQLLILLSLMSICLLILIASGFLPFYQLQYQILKTSRETITSNNINEIQNNYKYVANLTTSLAYNEIVQRYVNETGAVNQFQLNQNLMIQLVNTQSLEEYIMDIAIIGFNGVYANITGDIAFFTSLVSDLPEYSTSPWFFNKQEGYFQSQRLTYLIAGKYIYPLDISRTEPCGAVFIALDPARFLGSSLVSPSGSMLDTIIIDGNGQLLLGKEALFMDYTESRISPAAQKEFIKRYEYEEVPIGNLPFRLVSFIEKRALTGEINKIMYRQYIVLLPILAVIGIVYSVFISRFSRTLKHLITAMKKITTGEKGALKKRLEMDPAYITSYESEVLVSTFNAMLDEIANLNQRIFNSYTKMYETEIYARKTELAFLRSQINPHFLYNTLTLICGISTEGRTEEIANITLAMASVLRYSIRGKEMVTVQEELDIVKSYLMIQSCRFEGRFEIKCHVGENVHGALIPKMILQPLVENAIVHGLESKLECGILQIGCCQTTDKQFLVMWVYDTGVGMSHEKLEKLRNRVYSAGSIPSKADKGGSEPLTGTEDTEDIGIGLCNVNSRIRLHYGDEYHMIIDSTEGAGTNIQIKIPFTTSLSDKLPISEL